MKYIEAMDEYTPVKGETSLFLAGGITGCDDWQARAAAMLGETDLVVLNPRRANFPMNDSNESERQIKWEHRHLKRASGILFWFPKQTLCPITLFEYGRWIAAHKLIVDGAEPLQIIPKPLFVGCDMEYARSNDLWVQSKLERPKLLLHYSLERVIQEVRNWADAKTNPN